MRQTSDTDYSARFHHEERRAIRQTHVRVLGIYFSLTAFLIAGVALRIGLGEPQDDVTNSARSRGLFSAMAAERIDHVQCAQRDRRVLAAIEQHGDAQDVSSGKLAEAYFNVLSARAACASGAIEQALEIYDGIHFVRGPSTD